MFVPLEIVRASFLFNEAFAAREPTYAAQHRLLSRKVVASAMATRYRRPFCLRRPPVVSSLEHHSQEIGANSERLGLAELLQGQKQQSVSDGRPEVLPECGETSFWDMLLHGMFQPGSWFVDRPCEPSGEGNAKYCNVAGTKVCMCSRAPAIALLCRPAPIGAPISARCIVISGSARSSIAQGDQK